MKNEAFLGKCIKTLIDNHVSVKFNKRIYDSKFAFNFFAAGDKPELVINYFDPEKPWFDVFVHEYVHFLQWKENPEHFLSYDKYIGAFDKVLSGKQKRISDKYVQKIQELELDCDQRAVALITQNKLKLDIERYILESNIYIACHPLMMKYKKFYVPDTESISKCVPARQFDMQDLIEFNYDYESIEQKYIEKFVNGSSE